MTVDPPSRRATSSIRVSHKLRIRLSDLAIKQSRAAKKRVSINDVLEEMIKETAITR